MQQALIFDLDGVLADTAELHFRSWQRLAQELGIDFTRDDNEALLGLGRADALEILLGGRAVEGSREDLLARKNEYFLRLAAELGPADLDPGASRLLDEADSRSLPLGLASSSRNARLVCSRLGILDRFAAFADGNSGLRPKPAPDLFVWVAGRLGLEPSCCTVVEDSAAGVTAALEGGFAVVGVGPEDRVGRAHLRVERLADASLAEVLDPWPEREAIAP